MKLAIDTFTSLSGWSGSGPGAAPYALNEIKDYIADLNDKSAIFKFNSGSSGKYVTKTVAVNLSAYDQIVFHFWSRNKKKRGMEYNLSSDFAYAFDFVDTLNVVHRYYIPTYETFVDVTFKVSLANIKELRIVCLHDDEDYVIVSNLVAVKDEIPLDIFKAVKAMIELELNYVYSQFLSGVQNKGIPIGTVTASVGDKSIIFPDSLKFVDQYSYIRIDDGTNSEIHQVSKTDELEFFFNSVEDGISIKHNYTNANVYLIIPAMYGLSEKEIILPGISIWGMNPDEIQDVSKIENIRDTFKGDETVSNRKSDAKFRYVIFIDCEARHNELIAIMSQVVRYCIGRQVLWVNGKKIETFSDGTSTYVEPVEGYNEIPKIQYVMRVDIKEEIFNRETLVKGVSRLVDYVIKEQSNV